MDGSGHKKKNNGKIINVNKSKTCKIGRHWESNNIGKIKKKAPEGAFCVKTLAQIKCGILLASTWLVPTKWSYTNFVAISLNTSSWDW
jgi:hypothetical protein